VISRRGERKIHTLEKCGHVQMAKSDPEAQRKSSLSDFTWLDNEYGFVNLETLKFLMHFREPGSLFYFILFLYHTYSYIFFFFSPFFSHTHISFFYFSHYFSLFLSFEIFLFAPLEL
jgi:hypothetical protein